MKPPTHPSQTDPAGSGQIDPLDLGATATPLVPADRLGAALGFAPGALSIKRDDVAGIGVGGNKARKLEFLCADALRLGHDVVVTGGAPQSNHVRMTAAAAARCGLRAVAVLAGERPEEPVGNLVLDDLFGVELVFSTRDAMADAFRSVRADLVERGHRPYEIPLGGSSPVGALGYVTAADEIDAAAPDGSLVICADGSGGTHAGLVAGFGSHGRVLGVDVGFDDLEIKVERLASETAALAGRPAPSGRASIDPGQPAPYGEPTAAVEEAIRLVARTEGLVLDPVYTGRAMAALIARRRSGAIEADAPVVFLHTGGLPALFTPRYQEWFSWSPDGPLP